VGGKGGLFLYKKYIYFFLACEAGRAFYKNLWAIGGEPTFSSPPCEAAHYFLYIYIKRWSSFAGGGGGPGAFARPHFPLPRSAIFYIYINIYK